MTSVSEITAQIKALQEQLEEKRKAEFDAAVAQARSIVEANRLVPSDVFPSIKVKTKAEGESRKAPIKFRDPDTGNSWSGRGIQPKWLEGKDRAAYAVEVQQEQ